MDIERKNRELSDDELDKATGGEGIPANCPGQMNCSKEICSNCSHYIVLIMGSEYIPACAGF